MYALLFDNNQILLTMKNQFLPNYFKWIGLLMFIVGGVPDFIRGWNEGYGEGACNGCDEADIPFIFSEQTAFILSVISLLGMIIYSVSREKIEDEFTKVLRWESITLTFVLTVVLMLITLLIYKKSDIFTAYNVLEIQLYLYLIIFFFKKRSNLEELD